MRHDQYNIYLIDVSCFRFRRMILSPLYMYSQRKGFSRITRVSFPLTLQPHLTSPWPRIKARGQKKTRSSLPGKKCSSPRFASFLQITRDSLYLHPIDKDFRSWNLGWWFSGKTSFSTHSPLSFLRETLTYPESVKKMEGWQPVARLL